MTLEHAEDDGKPPDQDELPAETNAEISLEESPPKNPEKLVRTHSEISQVLGMFSNSGPPSSTHDKLFEKFEAQHVEQWIVSADNDGKRDFQLKVMDKALKLIYAFLIISTLGASAFYFYPRDPKIFLEILKMAIIFAGGVGAGFGIGKKKRDN